MKKALLMVTHSKKVRLKTMIKTNEKIIHLINVLMAVECVDDEKQKEYIEKAIYKTKKQLNIHQIVIAYHAKEYVKQYLEYLKTIK